MLSNINDAVRRSKQKALQKTILTIPGASESVTIAMPRRWAGIAEVVLLILSQFGPLGAAGSTVSMARTSSALAVESMLNCRAVLDYDNKSRVVCNVAKTAQMQSRYTQGGPPNSGHTRPTTTSSMTICAVLVALLVGSAKSALPTSTIPSFAFYGDSASRDGRVPDSVPWPTMQKDVVGVISMWSPSQPRSTVRPSNVVVADDPTGINQPIIVVLDAQNSQLVGLQQTNGVLSEVWSSTVIASPVTADLAIIHSAQVSSVVIGLQSGQLQAFEPSSQSSVRFLAPVAQSQPGAVPSDCYPSGSMASVNSSVALQAGLNVSASGFDYIGVAYSCVTSGPNIALVEGGSFATVWQAIPLNATTVNPPRSIKSGGVSLGHCGSARIWCLFVTDSLGGVTALDVRTGNYVWAVQTLNPQYTDLSPAAVDEHTGSLLVSSSSAGAAVRELDSVTGATVGTVSISGGALYALPPSIGWESANRFDVALLVSDRLSAFSMQGQPPSALSNLWYIVPGLNNARFVTATTLFGPNAAVAAGQQPGSFGVMALSQRGELTFSASQGPNTPSSEPVWRLYLTADRQPGTAIIVNTRGLTVMSDCAAAEPRSDTCVIVQMANGSVLVVGRVVATPLPSANPSPVSPSPSSSPQPDADGNNSGLVVGLSSAAAVVAVGLLGTWCFLRRRALAASAIGETGTGYDQLGAGGGFQAGAVGDDKAAWE